MESLVSEAMIVWKFALHNALKGKSAKECWLNKAYWVKGLYATWKSLKMAVQYYWCEQSPWISVVTLSNPRTAKEEKQTQKDCQG